MTTGDFQHWLDLYGNAWVAGDSDAVVQLFTADAAYYETPFDAPMIGTQAIHRYWTEGAKSSQTDVTFQALPISFDQDTGCAHWRATFRRVPSRTFVELDGVLLVKFTAARRCQELREWWHRREKEDQGQVNVRPQGRTRRCT
jgi:SnoaL-like domain